MSALSISLLPGMIRVDQLSPGDVEEFPIIGPSSALDIHHAYGKVSVATHLGMLWLGWPTADDLPANVMATISYHRANQWFYPEALLSLPGIVQQVSRVAL